ncbi:MAG: LLM class flavin-dependent oxidoreductase [Myxococcota bacterium]|nr:LLM class flavin-dependent oxidoreductase [Myxococcota bacterium]
MKYDIFFSISQTPVDGVTPSESEMFHNFFEQVKAADDLGYGTAWVAESHLSTEVQKQTSQPVVPHWQGEIGLNTDIFQLATHIFACTKNIHVGSAVMNIVCNGGPIAAAERIATFLALHGMSASERRRLCIGFSAGRFQFMNRAYGIVPRDEMEKIAWPALRGQVFAEACNIFLRLLSGETISSDDVQTTTLTRANFRSDEHWAAVQEAATHCGYPDIDAITVPNRWQFETLKIIPQDFRRDLLELVIGSHDPALQVAVNQLRPVKVFNLSITRPEVIDATHARMAEAFHADGGPWQREHMPRTVMVFINEQPGLTPEQRIAAAQAEARKALGAYWTALQGTLDPKKVDQAANNAIIGDAPTIAAQIRARFHTDERLMLWFDFFNHDSERVIHNMTAFAQKVVPLIEGK